MLCFALAIAVNLALQEKTKIKVKENENKLLQVIPGVDSQVFSEVPNILSRAWLYAFSRSSRLILSLPTDFSFESLPTSEVALEASALGGAVLPSSPRLMIFLGRIVGGGVLVLGAFAAAMLAREGGTRQKGVRKMRTEPEPAAECS